MIAIHCAMIQEADLIIKKYNLKLIDQLVNIKVYKNNDLLLVVSGIGKIQTSIALTYILNK
jgi:nucleoside phosphorylase